MFVKTKKKQNTSKFRRTKKTEPQDLFAYSGNRHLARVSGCTSPKWWRLHKRPSIWPHCWGQIKWRRFILLPSVVLLDFLYGQEFLKKVPPGLLSKSFFFLIILPYLDNYLLLGRPILKLIRHLSMDEQIPNHQVWANGRFRQVYRGKITDSY